MPRDAHRRGLQGDGDGDRLVRVEQQRREPTARAQPVTPVGAVQRVDRIAELAQALDVAPQGAGTDCEAVGQVFARPPGARPQQGQEPEQAR